ncbi:DNA polymerase alpha subunit B N-terminal-domain-containing protein [Zychaea mexicana]|uniref:DNA polymerase alpha subunit B N-terminal-domain-containing protein n=1 Tax=Zychaea mexicana TaxID=64656 RepID=UPI0022FE1AA2|nr:DNA polymerase alpha subunit B N-terminal-domain-containing protein [Zychaea mexicana]KAI9498209.1 DNA polymerase alpha subunit B N-terminal-domain-containing protein [Zychaea mexicana]
MSERELEETFGLDAKKNSDVVLELSSLCRIYDLSPQDIKFKWEAFTLNLGTGVLTPTVELVRQLKVNLQRELEQNLQQKSQQPAEQLQHRKDSKAGSNMSFDLSEYTMDTDEGDALENFMSRLTSTNNKRAATTKASRVSDVMDISEQLTSSQSQESGNKAAAPLKAVNAVEDSLNGNLSLRGPVDTTKKRTKIDLIRPSVKEYRYMFEKIKDRADVLDEQIDYLSEYISKDNEQEFTNPTRANQGEILAVGRICCDAAEGKLNDKSVVLETSRDLGMGKRVRLDLGKVQNYALFPGQIVGVKGTNITGRVFVAEEIFVPQVPSVLERNADDLTEISQLTQGKPIEIIVSAGPYTLDSDLSYQPLDELLRSCTKQRPDVVILLGPFVSENHPGFVNGSIDALPEDIFQERVASRLSKFAQECPGTRVMILPHADDIVQQYPVFPQPSLPAQSLGLTNIETLSNPALVDINGIAFAIGNIDIYKHLSREEIAKSNSDRLARLFGHVLQQHSFYPLFPAASTDSIDAERIADIQIPVKPDIFILPSQLKQTIKSVDQVLCVNPGQLSRRQTTGTYVRFTVHGQPSNVSSTDNDTIMERTRVDLIKL